MPLATIHSRCIVPDFIISHIISCPAKDLPGSDCVNESRKGKVNESRKGKVSDSRKEKVNECRKESKSKNRKEESVNESRKESVDDNKVHPLQVSTILRKIFSYLSFWQQKKCRVVCRTWNQELIHSMRKTSKVNLSKLLKLQPSLIPSLSSFINSYIVEDGSPEILRFIKNSNLFIKYIELQNILWSLELIVNFLSELPYLEELRIPIQCALPESPTGNIGSSCAGSSSPVITEHFPKLKVIVVTYTLKDLQIYSTRQNNNITISPLLDLCTLTPNLTSIYFPNLVQFSSPLNNPARILFKNIIYSGNVAFSQLKMLKIDTFLTSEDLYSLAIKNLPLQSLQLTLTADIGCDDLYELLYSVESTLETLNLTFRDGFRLTKRFPSLEKLKNMSVIIWNGYLNYLSEIEKLQNLVIVLMEVQMEMVNSGNCLSSSTNTLRYKRNDPVSFSERSNIKQMEIHGIDRNRLEINGPLVLKTIRLSPCNLQRLTLDHASDPYLRLIFRSLRLLEELVILYGDWTESGLTGIPKEYCKPDIFQKEFYAIGLKEFPGITDLKYLRSIILTGVITDFSIMMGVSKCRKMKSLELIAQRYSKLSDCSLMKIADVMDLHYLRMTNFTPNVNVSVNGLQYLKNKFAGIELHLNV